VEVVFGAVGTDVLGRGIAGRYILREG